MTATPTPLPSAEALAKEYGYDHCLIIGFNEGGKDCMPYTDTVAFSEIARCREKLLGGANKLVDMFLA